MISNYFLVALRALRKNLLNSSINIVGLSMGMAAVIMIFSYVRFERSYDQHFLHHDRIVRISLSFPDGELERALATNYPLVHRTFPGQFPEIEKSTRIYNAQFSGNKSFVRIDKEVFPDQVIYYGDPTFFEVFHFDMISGNALKALTGKDKAVITREAAERYFGTTDCLGKILSLDKNNDFIVSGVIENIPVNTHFHFDVMVTMENHPFEKQAEWNGVVFSTYFLMREGADLDAFSSKIGDYLVQLRGDGNPEKEMALRNLMPLMPLKDIHLMSHMEMELEANGNIKYVVLFSSIAVFILLIACINYVNLATSQSLDRAREVGLRKIFGAFRGNLVLQFLGESMLISVIAFVLALGMIELFRPYFNSLVDLNVSYGFFFEKGNLLYYALFIVMISLLSGLYPAVFLSGYVPEQVLKGKFSRSVTATRFRKILVGFQFYVTMFLIVGSLVVYSQLRYMLSKNLGIDTEHIVAIPIYDEDMMLQLDIIKEKMKDHHAILSGTAVSQLPININFTEGVSDNMTYQPEDVEMFFIHADEDFFETMGLEILMGNGFSRPYSDQYTEYVVNKAAMHALGETTETLFKRDIRVKHGGITLGPVVGLVDNFNFASLHDQIGPLVVSQNPGWYSYLLFKIQPANLTETLEYMKITLRDLFPEMPFEYQFLDTEFDNLYKSEIKLSRVVAVFTFLGIFIACIGLFGLSAFDTVQRTKEIGIRKVLGSTTIQVTALFLKENLILIFIALLVAVPSSYLAMNIWLQGFAYHIKVGLGVILPAMFFVLGITIFTVSYHAIRAAHGNPSETLRYE